MPKIEFRKVAKAVFFALFSPLFFILCLFIRLLRPVVLIRFNILATNRIGHLTGNTEAFLCEKDAGMHGRRVFDIFITQKKICNTQLLRMWKRVVPVWFNHYFGMCVLATNKLIPGWQDHINNENRYFDKYGLWDNTRPHLKFSEDEEKWGAQKLKEMGLADKPFVCFICRDKAYLSHTYPHYDFSYLDYRDANIENLGKAVKGLVNRGYTGIRMGAVVSEKIKFAAPRIIDYATSGLRSDFMDVYLTARCRFFIFSESGLGVLAMILRKPVVCINLIPMAYLHAWSKDYLVIPRKLWFKSEKRFLRFDEIINSPIGQYMKTDQYVKAGIEPIENTADEVNDAVEEMALRLEGTWQTNDEYEDLQRRFWSLYQPNDILRVFRSRIGSKFLLQNKGLLGKAHKPVAAPIRP